MENYTIGQLLKNMRTQLGVTQQKLAGSFIERATLSKIEAGKRTASVHTMDVLFERLGYSLRRYFPAMLSADEKAFYDKREQVNACIRTGDARGIAQGIAELEAGPLYHDPKYIKDGMVHQFVASSKAALVLLEKGDMQQAMTLLNRAIAYTIPKYEDKMVHTYLLTIEDIEIITMMAEVHEKQTTATAPYC